MKKLSGLLVMMVAACSSDPATPPANDAGTDTGTPVVDVPVTPDTGGGTTPVEIRFRAMVGAMPFACGMTYSGLGTTMSTWRPKDFRFYVHDVKLLTASGTEVPVTLAEEMTWQRDGVALLDFEDRAGDCAEGNPPTNTSVRGSAPAGTYTGLRFTLGVPFRMNHQNQATAASPMNLSAMFWSWQSGYKFLKIDGATRGVTGFNIHLGSTGCDGNAMGSVTMCSAPNRATVTLMGFNPASSTVVADLARLIANTNVDMSTGAPGCMSSPTDPECTGIFANLGLPINGGMAPMTQSFFRVE